MKKSAQRVGKDAGFSVSHPIFPRWRICTLMRAFTAFVHVATLKTSNWTDIDDGLTNKRGIMKET